MSGRGRRGSVEAVPEQVEEEQESEDGSKGKGRMEDVELASTVRSDMDAIDRDEPPDDLMAEVEDGPAAFLLAKSRKGERAPKFGMNSSFLPRETGQDARQGRPGPPSSSDETVPPTLSATTIEPPLHDAFWGKLYLLSLGSLLASFVLVWLHTSAPGSKHPLGDTIYTTLHASFYLLAVDTVVAVIVSLLWISLLRSYVRPLVYFILIAVPIILFSFSLYPFISSYKGPYHGSSLQDRVMRWGSFIPFVLGFLWTMTVYRGRHSFGKAVGILEFACRILEANPALLMVGLATLAAIVTCTWVWMLMFTRVFLGGHLSKALFIIDSGTWALGIFFVLVYLWTLSIISGLQRAATAATVSQWYFHRLAVPAPKHEAVVRASVIHATTTLFGTICLSTLLTLLVRLPLLVLPRRLIAIVSIVSYSLIPTPIAALTNPLTLTYAAIHSQPLSTSSRALTQMSFLSPNTPTTTLYPRSTARSSYSTINGAPLLPYRLAKLLLHATRFIMSAGLGFGGWVSTARTLTFQQDDGNKTIKGSLYAYVVGLIAAAIGWGILGAMEGVLGGVVDAAVVCYGSEVGANANGSERGEARYCREAGELFGREEARGDLRV